MARVLLTAFEPYAPWQANASWLSLVELTRELPSAPEVTTRLYPADLETVKARLTEDLKSKYDVAIHVGQAPRTSCIQLEEVALNVFRAERDRDDLRPTETVGVVCPTGPVAYRTGLPLADYVRAIQQAGIPARVCCRGGTSWGNATLYWSYRLTEELELMTKPILVHVPLDTSQVIHLHRPAAFMPAALTASALRILLKLTTDG